MWTRGRKYEQCEERDGKNFYALKELHTTAYQMYNRYLNMHFKYFQRKEGK